jgi:GIY-YIG catalytic domain
MTERVVEQATFETSQLVAELGKFLNQEVVIVVGSSGDNPHQKLGNFKYGVYAFFDYDGEPIYVGQTNEQLRVRIQRHLTNQRTDAVAMKVLDPFEVFEIEVWPLLEFEGRPLDNAIARRLNWLERAIFERLVAQSRFNAILNEKDPPSVVDHAASVPSSVRGRVVSDAVLKLRGHPDTRIARRAETLSLLAKVIAERRVQSGLRRTLLTQANRLAWLAEKRSAELRGSSRVGIQVDDLAE